MVKDMSETHWPVYSGFMCMAKFFEFIDEVRNIDNGNVALLSLKTLK